MKAKLTGQATTLIMVLFFGGVQLISLGIIGEYIGRIYDEVKGRPLYIIAEAPTLNPASSGLHQNLPTTPLTHKGEDLS